MRRNHTRPPSLAVARQQPPHLPHTQPQPLARCRKRFSATCRITPAQSASLMLSIPSRDTKSTPPNPTKGDIAALGLPV